MIRRLWKTLKLGFDRSFSGASWKQITWLFGILALVLGFSLWIKSYCTAELHDMRILELLLDPGSFVLQDGDPLGYERLPLLALTFLGAIFFTGGLISVVSNILTGRIARFRQGEIRYRFDGHIVLLGANDTAAGLIRELHAEPENRRRDIVLLTQSDAEALRRKLHAELSPAEERRLIILHGQRDSREELEKIHIHRADRVFVLSDDGELEHDSVSISALVQISAILGAAHRRDPLPCHLSFEYQSSFQVFQLADFEEAERMKSRIHFSATNFHENWAQRVLVSGCCNCNGRDILYPPLDRDGIRAQSDRYVHLIVVGMSRMGVAMGVTAAHIAHYPNFVTQGIRTRITFIDPDAEREMNFLKGRYEPLFRLSHHTLRKFDAAGSETTNVHTPGGFSGRGVGIRRRRHRIAPRAQTAQRLDGRRKGAPHAGDLRQLRTGKRRRRALPAATALRPASSDLRLSEGDGHHSRNRPPFVPLPKRISVRHDVRKLRRHTQTAHPQGQTHQLRLQPFHRCKKSCEKSSGRTQ